ncbi:hypothetical protein D3C83_327080 [compost metagenome]
MIYSYDNDLATAICRQPAQPFVDAPISEWCVLIKQILGVLQVQDRIALITGIIIVRQ